MITKIIEYITFGDFNTRDKGWYLQSRDAPTPEEKSVVESLLYSQGTLDFSMNGNERFFENRIITYEFKLPNTAYLDRKTAERKIKNELMSIGQSQLFDTHDIDFYWYGKCKSVKIKDDPVKRSLIATIEFDCYPFLIAYCDYFDDVWDTFNFEYGVANWSLWTLTGKTMIPIFNPGNTTTIPKIISTKNITIVKDGIPYNFNAGESESVLLKLQPGEISYLEVSGTGKLSIRFAMEVMG